MSKPIALVTGGAGFIGSHLCDALLERGFAIRCYDDLSHGSMANISQALINPCFEFWQNDVCDHETLARAMDGANLVFHLAARKIPRYGDALSTLRVNNDGTRNIFELAEGRNCKVILASTSDVYGKGNPPFKESDDLVLGSSDIRRWSYAASKIFDEHLALAYYDEKNVPAVVLRFFGSYGPRNHPSWWGGPQAVFIEQALKNEQITVHGDGSQTRSFTFIDDLVTGILLASEEEKAVGQIINIGSNEEISILDLANLIYGLVWPNKSPQIMLIPYESFGGHYEDVMRRLPDLSKAETILGFHWHTNLRDGLPRTIAWHKKGHY